VAGERRQGRAGCSSSSLLGLTLAGRGDEELAKAKEICRALLDPEDAIEGRRVLLVDEVDEPNLKPEDQELAK
jgi:hypothetical protein